MHLVLYVRGLYPQVKLWESMAQGLHWKWRRVNKETGEEKIILVQGGLRPSMMGSYEYIFPKEALPEVLKVFGIGKGQPISKGKVKGNFKVGVLRKILGVKKIPASVFEEAETYSESIVIEGTERGLSHVIIPGVAVHAIGIKEDVFGEMFNPIDKTTHIQEML